MFNGNVLLLQTIICVGNFRFTDRSRFPKDAEIGAGAAFIEVDAMDSMDIVCPTYRLWGSSNKYEQLIIHQVSNG